MLPENACHCEEASGRRGNPFSPCAQGAPKAPLAVTKGGEQRLPLLIKGSCHEVTEGIRTSGIPRTLCECNFTIPQSRACVRRASQLPLHKGAGGCSRTSAFIDISQKNLRNVPHSFMSCPKSLYHIHGFAITQYLSDRFRQPNPQQSEAFRTASGGAAGGFLRGRLFGSAP